MKTKTKARRAKREKKGATRTYLTARERHTQLLDAAAAVVSADGWRGLSMTGIAQEAGVSRQLVYEHFSDLNALCTELLHHLFDRLQSDTLDVIANGQLDPKHVVSTGVALFLDAPRAHRRALRTLVADPDDGASELEPTKRALRQSMIALWLPHVRSNTRLPDATARAVVWSAINAVWGLTDLVDDGEVTRAEAIELAGAFLDPSLLAARSRRTPRSKRRQRADELR